MDFVLISYCKKVKLLTDCGLFLKTKFLRSKAELFYSLSQIEYLGKEPPQQNKSFFQKSTGVCKKTSLLIFCGLKNYVLKTTEEFTAFYQPNFSNEVKLKDLTRPVLLSWPYIFKLKHSD